MKKKKRKKKLALLLQRMPTVVNKIRTVQFQIGLIFVLLILYLTFISTSASFWSHQFWLFSFFADKGFHLTDLSFSFIFFRCSFPSILFHGASLPATVSVQFKIVILTIVHSRNMQWVYYPLFWHQYAWGHARTWRLSFLSYLHVLAFWVIVIVGNAGLHCHKLCPLLYVWRQ